MKKRLIILTSISLILAVLTGCDIFSANTISGHVVLSNTPIEEDKFNLTAVELEEEVKEADYHPNQLIIRFKEQQKAKEYLDQRKDLTELKSLIDDLTYLVEVDDDPADLINELATEEIVEYAELNLFYQTQEIRHPDNAPAYYHQQWHYSAISLENAWPLNTGSQDIKVAVLDTGIDTVHPEFQELEIIGKNFTVGAKSDYQDRDGHGTHVAGTIVAPDNEKVVGVNWDLTLLVAKVFPDDGASDSINSDIAEAIKWASDEGADIINLSLGGPFPAKTMEMAIDYAASNGVAVVAAGGNEFGGELSFPARYKNAISVGAVNSSLEIANFSNKGVELDLVAPGVGVYSTDINDSYSFKSGTSMAAPHVSGLAALVLAEDNDLSLERLKERLKLTAQDLGAQNDGNQGWDSTYGHGLVNAHAAITGAEINQAVVFAGEKESRSDSLDIIYQQSEVVTVNSAGFYEFELLDGAYDVYAWIDVNGSGQIDQGDYLAKNDGPISEGIDVDLTLELVRETDSIKVE